MSNISKIYDNFLLIVETLFPDKSMLPDPRNLEANPSVLLKDGVGISWESGSSNDELSGCSYVEARNVSVIFTNRVARLDTNASASMTIEKGLFEDRKVLINEIKKQSPYPMGAEYFEFESDDGILSVRDEKQNIIYLKINFELRYKEVVE